VKTLSEKKLRRETIRRGGGEYHLATSIVFLPKGDRILKGRRKWPGRAGGEIRKIMHLMRKVSSINV